MELLESFLNRIGQKFTEDWYEIRDVQNWMLEEIYRKRIQFPHWKKKMRFSWVSFKKNKTNMNNPISFFYYKLDEMFRYFFQKMYPLDDTRLTLIGKLGENKNTADIFFEYKYTFIDSEIQDFNNFKEKFKHPEHPDLIISYIFNIIISVFGMLSHDIVNKNIQIAMLAATIKRNDDGKYYLHFLLVVRKVDVLFLKGYLRTMIYNFAEVLPGINEPFLDSLRHQRNQIYSMAFKQYKESKKNLATVLFTLERKCQIINQATPLLDILNFICARAEDSVYDIEHFVKNIIKTKIIQKNKKVQKDLYDIFQFFNQNASLFSTFQSNNRAIVQRQYQLFFFYTQYFCGGGLDVIKMKDHFFFNDMMNDQLNNDKLLSDVTNFENMTLSSFLIQGPMLLDNPAIPSLFKQIFAKDIFEINEMFFDSFLYSLNQKIHLMLEEKRSNNWEFTFDFDEIVHVISIILYNLASQIFLADTPKEASQGFKDQLGRYTPERVALRAMELNIFKDIPLSDNNWQDYYLSRNKVYIKKIFKKYYDIPESYFFSPRRLLKINIMYERGIVEESNNYLEQWMVETILKPFLRFQKEINKTLGTSCNEQQLHDAIVTFFQRWVID